MIQQVGCELSGPGGVSDASPTRLKGHALVGGVDRSPCTPWQPSVVRPCARVHEEKESFAPQLGVPTRHNG